jgi:carboxymethylenebutenolidase
MHTRIAMLLVSVTSLAVGYAFGQAQRPTLAAAAPSAAVDPHAAHAIETVLDEHAGHAAEAAASAVQAVSSNRNIPPSTEGAKARLDASPRHSEYVKIATADGAPLNMWVSYPERRDKAPVVVLIHGASAFDDWIRAVGDRLASEGFIAVVPDFLTGKGPNGGGSDAFAGADDRGKAIQTLTRPEMIARLHAAREYGVKLPAANGKSAVLGFCFGGSQTFMYATQQPNLNAAVVFYGSAPVQPGTTAAGPGAAPPATYIPDRSMLANIKAPVLGLYGGADERINATVPGTQAMMKALGKPYEVHYFEGAGHAFLSGQGGQNGANLKASEGAWPLAVAFLKRHLENGGA